MAHADLVHEAADALAPALDDARLRVVRISGQALRDARDEPVRTAIAAAAVGTLVFALWHLLSARRP